MRIIRGIYGRRRFQVPSTFAARPTTDFAKENLFNVLENIVTWDDTQALDLFSGTGSIAFELLSRGCSRVTAVESDRTHAAFIADVARRLAPPPVATPSATSARPRPSTSSLPIPPTPSPDCPSSPKPFWAAICSAPEASSSSNIPARTTSPPTPSSPKCAPMALSIFPSFTPPKSDRP